VKKKGRRKEEERKKKVSVGAGRMDGGREEDVYSGEMSIFVGLKEML